MSSLPKPTAAASSTPTGAPGADTYEFLPVGLLDSPSSSPAQGGLGPFAVTGSAYQHHLLQLHYQQQQQQQHQQVQAQQAKKKTAPLAVSAVAVPAVMSPSPTPDDQVRPAPVTDEATAAFLQRASSAPPILHEQLVTSADAPSPVDPALADPAYHAYYYSHRRLDPRLPPPQSAWPPANASAWRQQGAPGAAAKPAAVAAPAPVPVVPAAAVAVSVPDNKLSPQLTTTPAAPDEAIDALLTSPIDLIQNDFPRTPSSIFGNSGLTLNTSPAAAAAVAAAEQRAKAQRLAAAASASGAAAPARLIDDFAADDALRASTDLLFDEALAGEPPHAAALIAASQRAPPPSYAAATAAPGAPLPLHAQNYMPQQDQYARMWAMQQMHGAQQRAYYDEQMQKLRAGEPAPPAAPQPQPPIDASAMYGNPYLHQQMMMMGYPAQYAPMMDPRLIAMMYAQPHLMASQQAAAAAAALHRGDMMPPMPGGASLSYAASPFGEHADAAAAASLADGGAGLNFLRASSAGSGAADIKPNLGFEVAPAPAVSAAAPISTTGNKPTRRGVRGGGGGGGGGPNKQPQPQPQQQNHQQQSPQPLASAPVVVAAAAATAAAAASAAPMSELLQKFHEARSSQHRFRLSDIKNHVVEFSRDQFGSRFIQQQLETASASEKSMVFEEIVEGALPLMVDVFGNYVVQKFFEYGAPEQKRLLADRLRGHVEELALQMYGCRVIQKALETIGVDQQVALVRELEGAVLRCVRDQNGNHVVQKCIERIPSRRIQFIIDGFRGEVVSLATHAYGCRVIQRILEHCHSGAVEPLMQELTEATVKLARDQYGNYVIQHILQHGDPPSRQGIVKRMRGKYLILSQHKFASNVMEKCVQYGSQADRDMIINELLERRAPPPANGNGGSGAAGNNQQAPADDGIITLMKDQYGNYVMQRVLDVSTAQQREKILEIAKPNLNSLRRFTYGKHIITKIEKIAAQQQQQQAAAAATSHA